MTNAKRVRRWMSFHCAEIGRVTEPAFTESLVEVLDAAEKRGFEKCREMAKTLVLVQQLEDLNPCCVEALRCAKNALCNLKMEDKDGH